MPAYLALMLLKGIKKKIGKRLSGVLTLLLLVLYAVGSLQVESFHRLLHSHDEVVLHTVEQEQNDCHRLVYHNQSKGDCKHKSHVTENKNCPLCQISVQQLHIGNEFGVHYFSFKAELHHVSMPEAIIASIVAQLPARAPPFFS